jgi:hypothetical protein
MRPFAYLALLTCALSSVAAAEVRLVRDGAKFQLLRDGKPYFVRGGGGGAHSMESLAKAGGNSLRLWGDDDLGAQLDAAQKHGLTIAGWDLAGPDPARLRLDRRGRASPNSASISGQP